LNRMKLQNRSLEIAYHDIGEGTPCLLLHGFCGSSAYWDELIPLLAPQFRLIVPDLPGHGQSSVPEQPYPIEAYADDLNQLLRQLQIDQAVWFGHSMGGYITLAAAERHASDLIAFGLIHSTANPDDEKGKQNRDKSMQTIEQDGIETFIDGLIPKLFAPQHLTAMPEKVEKAKSIGRRTPPLGARIALMAMKNRPDRNVVLQTTELPVFLAAGKNDQIVPPEKVFTVENELQNRVVIEQAGHMSMMEDPEFLANAMKRFLKR